MKTENRNGNEKNRRVSQSVNHDRMRDVSRNGTEENWKEQNGIERKGLEDENNFGTGREFGMALENKFQNEGESKSIHVEDWENDPFSYSGENEKDVEGEFRLRKNSKGWTGKNDKESKNWEKESSETLDYKRRNEYRSSGKDETIGVP